MRIMLKSKIHRATVTEANVNYEGSITIDKSLMEKADILEGEKVLVVDNTTGARLETYALPGEKDSGIICMNGGSARLISKGDIITVLAFEVTDKVIEPKKILVDSNNKVKRNI
ncbi:MAG: aspartate 1-decarboxylase [Desulfobacterales bacterium]|nr:aspartate 1-decarboxylase [Desulfobacterales bacterium]MBF0396789.1 aspartate 1-decarboxylase [Desulfobacterales bacterium]